MTNDEINEFRIQSEAMGDDEMVRECDKALAGSQKARKSVEETVEHRRANGL